MLSNFRPFLTGSHAYGIPNDKSDIDLVVYVSLDSDLEKLRKMADHVCWKEGEDVDEEYLENAHSWSLRFNKLNMICCTDYKVYEAWRTITSELESKAPVPRDFAVKYMAQRREELLGGNDDGR